MKIENFGISGKTLDIVLIIVATAIIYYPSLDYEFVNWDENIEIENNEDIKAITWENLQKIFITNYNSAYQPFKYILYSIVYSISKLDPTGYRIASLILHLVNVVLVYVLMKRITGLHFVTLIATALFALHPLQVESISWIPAVNNPLSGVFFLGGLIFYLKYLDSNQLKDLYITFFLSLGALFSKTTSVTFPFVLILFDILYKRPLLKKALLEKIPFFVAALIFGVMELFFREEKGSFGMAPEYGVFDRIFLFTYAVSFYIFKLILPLNQSNFNLFPNLKNGHLPVEFYLSAIGLVLLFAFIFYSRHKRILLIIFGFYIATLLPVLKIVPFGFDIASERYVYLSCLPVFVLLGYVLSGEILPDQIKKFSLAIAGGLLILFSYLTYERTKVWQNGNTFWNDAIGNYSERSFGYKGRGVFNFHSGKHEIALKDLDTAINISPERASYYEIRSEIKLHLDDTTGAIQDLEQVLKTDPKNSVSMHNLGSIYLYQKDYDKAIYYYEKELQIKDINADTYYGLGLAHMYNANYQQAHHYLSEAIKLTPENPELYFYRAFTNRKLNNSDEAISDYSKAIEAKPDFGEAYRWRGKIYLELKDTLQAKQDLTMAEKLNSG